MKRIEMINRVESGNANGTSYHGHKIKATLNELKELYGEPNNGDDDKVKHDWVLQMNDKTIFTIYDWKQRQAQDDVQTIWHVGGFSAHDTSNAKNMIELELIDMLAIEMFRKDEGVICSYSGLLNTKAYENEI